jgi:AcrR family transcriptional regulator
VATGARKTATAVRPARRPREAAKQARTDVYRQHILEAAEKVFAEHGYDAAPMQEIARRAGLSMGVIYGIFPGKAELYAALLDARGREVVEAARAVATREAKPRDALFALAAMYVDFFVARPDFLRMHLRSGASWALGPAARGSADYWQAVHDLQAEIFRRGVASGDFVDEDPAYLAKTFSVLDQVLLADWAARGMKASRDELVRRLQAMVARALCR